jgi:AraC-like DNA-binding protein
MSSPVVMDPRSAQLAASTSSVLTLRVLVDALARAGGRPALLLRRIGVPADVLRHIDARIPFDALLRAWELAPKMVGDDAFGLRLAASARRGSFGMLEYAARASDTLGDALDRRVRYQPVLHDRARFTVACAGERATIFMRIADLPSGAPRHFNEAIIAALLRLAREMTGFELTPHEVAFQHPAPAALHEHRRVLRVPLYFGAPQNHIVVQRSVLELPLREADPALAAVLDHSMDRALERTPTLSGIALCRELVASQIGAGGQPTVSYIARELSLSQRSLQRVLSENGLTFREVVDDVRKEIAIAWASHTDEQASQIAYRLGYADASAFHHAFRRWTGHTVREFRRRGALLRSP